MTADAAVYRRVLRRETHAARTVPAVAVASFLALFLIGALVMGVWALIDPSLREAATVAAGDVISAVDAVVASTVAGVVLVLIAVLLIGLAVLPGRRSRHGRMAGRMAVLIDDGVLADVVADRVAAGVGVDRSQVSVTVGRRIVFVRVTPSSGLPIGEQTIREAAAKTLSEAGFEAVAKATVSDRGVIS